MFNGRLDLLLAGATASGLLILGIGETIARLDEPMPLFFWLPTLWGGAALVFAGGFLVRGNPRLASMARRNPLVIGEHPRCRPST